MYREKEFVVNAGLSYFIFEFEQEFVEQNKIDL